MELKFYKYHGNGNDFIAVDNRNGIFIKEPSIIKKICHRHFGIGSDGIILIENDPENDFFMDFFNPDGSQSLCGNGSRCALHLTNQLGMIENEAVFRVYDGIHQGRLSGNASSISLADNSNMEINPDFYYIHTGSPHVVKFVDNVEAVNLIDEARKIRYGDIFKSKGGTNVNFVQRTKSGVKSRTYERGVENETFSSGTGTTAIALCSVVHFGLQEQKVSVETRGGLLSVSFNHGEKNAFSNIWLSGSVEQVYTGRINL